jgi:hypothetical protein
MLTNAVIEDVIPTSNQITQSRDGCAEMVLNRHINLET